VEDYKAGIKAQLTRAGLIRGQPKSSILQASSAGPSSSSVFPSQQFQSSASSSGSSRVNDLGMPAYVDPLGDPTGMSVFGGFVVIGGASLQQLTQHHLGSTLNSPQIVPVPLYSRDGTFQRSNHNSPFSPSGSLPSHPSPVADMHFNPEFDTATQNLYNPPMPSMPDDGLQMEHIFYYFEHVRQLQYAFAGNSVANITYSVKFSLKKLDTSLLTVI
jgi:hypothetical protein